MCVCQIMKQIGVLFYKYLLTEAILVPGHLYEVYVTSGPELKPLAGTFYDHVPKDTVIVIYGDMGKSEQLPLVAGDDGSSSPGNTQYFKVMF